MSKLMTKSGLLALLALAILWLPALVRAADSLLPVVPEAQRRVSETQGCVEPTEDMRRNHMKYILHQRDETVHEGIRTKQHSLEECIDCHVSSAPDAPRVSSEQHFCNSCHTYAAVNIDCFECHADRPLAETGKQSMTPISPSARLQKDEKLVALPPGNHQQLSTEGINHD
jgi:[DsrC]-trisulfide reductase subunit J